MLSKLTEISLRQQVLVLLAALALAAGGAWAFVTLPIDAYPDISPTQVKMILKAPGMTPEEVESRVIAPLEMELLGTPRITPIISRSRRASGAGSPPSTTSASASCTCGRCCSSSWSAASSRC